MPKVHFTDRCTQEDLEELMRLNGDVADVLVQKCKSMRGTDPESGDHIVGLTERRCYSIHGSRYRGATWYDRTWGAVWILALGIHRDDSPDDFYDVVQRIERAGRLYPTEADYQRLADTELIEIRETEARYLLQCRNQAVRHPERGRIPYNSPNGLQAQVWAEVVPDISVVCVRIRMALANGQFLSDVELATLLAGPFTNNHLEKPDPDNEWPYRYFEEYFDPSTLP